MGKLKSTLLVIIILVPFNVVASEWRYSKQIDEFTDISTFVASSYSVSGKGVAAVTCNEKLKFNLYFSVGEYIGSDDKYTVRYRVDKKDPESGKWGVSTEGVGVFASEKDKVHLAREMLFGDLLLLEVTDFRGTPHQAKYSLKGAQSAIGKVLDACNIESRGFLIRDIDHLVVENISEWGPKYTICKKQMLIALGYSISDISSKKTPDLYQASQKYVDDKHTVCGTNEVTSLQKIYECEQKHRFLYGLYRDAYKKDSSFKEKCSSIGTRD